MNLIAIDPGSESSAVLQWDGERVKDPMILPNWDLLQWVRMSAPHLPMSVEMIACYGMPVGAETFQTCLMIGRIQEIWTQKLEPIRLVYRREVKIHLCGTMKAKDPHIRQALIDRFGIVGTKKSPGKLYGVSSHLWSALAVAVFSLDTSAKPDDDNGRNATPNQSLRQ
jgi:hypothetical protein